MSLSNYLENKILDHLFGGTTYTAPSTLYIGLCQSVSEDGTIVGEPSGGGYARVAVSNNTTNWPNASDGTKSNGTIIEFPEATANWGTMYYGFIADAASGGNVLAYFALEVPKTIEAGDVPFIAPGDLRITID